MLHQAVYIGKFFINKHPFPLLGRPYLFKHNFLVVVVVVVVVVVGLLLDFFLKIFFETKV